MLPDADICERARRTRAPRFDGRFLVAVPSTGVYCRPVCPSRPPARDDVRYFPTTAAARDAGYSPCLRCRPERASPLPSWTLASETVTRALRLIDDGYLAEHGTAALAAAVGVSARQLDRLFRRDLGASPGSIAGNRRSELAKRLIDDTRMSFADIALAAGYGSVRRFNDDIRRLFGRPPSALRRLRPVAADGTGLRLTLPVRAPFHWDWAFDFLGKRLLAGVESVHGHRYVRRLADGGEVEVRRRGDRLELTLPPGTAGATHRLLARVRRLFDLDADPLAVAEALAADDVLGVGAAPGLRVPGAWDGFELAVRAVLGQQVSVAGATTLAGRLVERFGDGVAFPEAGVLASADVAAIGMPRARGAAIAALARAVTAGDVCLDGGMAPGELRRTLGALPGFGPWTAEYIAMRAGRDPDAFPDSDWVVMKVLGARPAAVRRQAEAWRPWRSYALMYLWYGASANGARVA